MLASSLTLVIAPASLLAGQSATNARSADTVSLSLADARRLALGANLDLQAARLDTAIARGDLRQASVFRFNPSAEVLGGGDGAEGEISQEIEVFGQRSARIAAGRAGVDRARAAVNDAVRRILGDVDRAFYRRAAATRRVALAANVLTLNQRLSDVAARQLAAGEISRLDYNLAVVEFGRSRSRLLAARREAQQVSIELARLTGLSSRSTIVPVLDSLPLPAVADTLGARDRDTSLAEFAQSVDVDSLVAVALTRRPDVAERRAALREADARTSVARREAFPNLVIRAGNETNAAGTGRTWRPGVGIAIPVFNHNQGEAAARRAAASQAQREQRALVERVRAEVTSAILTYQSAAFEVDVLERTVLRPARQNRELLEIAYREGEVGLPVLLLIRNQVIDAELEYWTTWLAEREARAALDEATGENLVRATARSATQEGAR